MKYLDGQDVRLGDKVQLWAGTQGIVVCSLDTQEYSPVYSEAEGSYLKNGVLILSDTAGLIHYVEASTIPGIPGTQYAITARRLACARPPLVWASPGTEPSDRRSPPRIASRSSAPNPVRARRCGQSSIVCP